MKIDVPDAVRGELVAVRGELVEPWTALRQACPELAEGLRVNGRTNDGFLGLHTGMC